MTNESREWMTNLEEKLDITIGYNWWKKYVACVFWCNFSTPLNFTITLLTAVTTTQTTTENLISHSLSIQLSILTLLLTTINTFFKPNTEFTQNNDILQKWNDLGIKFEEIYYSDKEEGNLQNIISSYKELYNDVIQLEEQQSQSFNCITDCLFFIVRQLPFLKNKDKWLDNDRAMLHLKN